MPITNIPTFADGELPSASKLNQLGTAISTKFSGSIAGSDLSWPLIAQGALDMNENSINNLQKLWNVVNVAEYDTFADAVAALPTNGGSLFIPPGTVTTDGAELDTSNTLVFGTGRGSVLKLTSGSTSGYLVRTATALENIGFCDLTIDGNSATGSGQDGVQIRDCDGVRISGCHFKGFSGEHLVLTHSGTQGNPTENALIYGCHFKDGSGDQLLMDDVDGVQIVGCNFDNPTTKGINGTPSSASSIMRSILVQGCTVSGCNNGIYIVGGGGTEDDKWRLVKIIGNEIVTDAGNGITCGTTSAIVKYGLVSGNIGFGVSGDGINALLSRGKISDNCFPEAGGDGLDLLASANVWVQGNDFSSATTKGIDASACDSCVISGNNLRGAAEAIDLDGATTPYVSGNLGYHDGSQDTIYAATPGESKTGVYVANYIIPASTVKVGDVVRVFVKSSTAAASPTLAVSLDGGTTELSVGEYSAAGRSAAVAEFVVEGLTGTNTLASSLWVATTNQGEADAQTFTVDWTSDVTVTFESASADISLDYFSVEIIGGTT